MNPIELAQTHLLESAIDVGMEAFLGGVAGGVLSYVVHRKAMYHFRRTGETDLTIATPGITIYLPKENSAYHQKIRNRKAIRLTDIFEDSELGELAIKQITKAIKKCDAENPSVFQHLQAVGTEEKVMAYINRTWFNFFSGYFNSPDDLLSLLVQDATGHKTNFPSFQVYPVLIYEESALGLREPKIIFMHQQQLDINYYKDKIPQDVIISDPFYPTSTLIGKPNPQIQRLHTMYHIASNIRRFKDRITLTLGIDVVLNQLNSSVAAQLLPS